MGALLNDVGESPTIGKLAYALADSNVMPHTDANTAEETIHHAVNDAPLRETDDGMFGIVVLANRDGDGVVILAHTAALREDMPVVAEGEMVAIYNETTRRVAEAVTDLAAREFTSREVREQLDE